MAAEGHSQIGRRGASASVLTSDLSKREQLVEPNSRLEAPLQGSPGNVVPGVLEHPENETFLYTPGGWREVRLFKPNKPGFNSPEHSPETRENINMEKAP